MGHSGQGNVGGQVSTQVSKRRVRHRPGAYRRVDFGPAGGVGRTWKQRGTEHVAPGRCTQECRCANPALTWPQGYLALHLFGSR